MNAWSERQLGELIHIKHGFAFGGDYIVDYDNGVVLVTPGNFKIGGGFQHSGKKFFSGEVPDDYVLQSNSLIVTMTDLSKNADTLGYAAYVPDDEKIYLHNQRIGLVSIVSDEINEKYLYWLLRTPWYQRRIANTCNGANVKHTSPDRIYKYKFLLPTQREQERIANILSAYDDLIEANNRRIELLEQAAQELYKEWFVRFRFPGYKNTKFENGLPEGWQIKPIGVLFDITSSKRVYLADYVDNGVPFYRSKEIIQLSQGQAITDPLYISNESYAYFKNKFGVPEKNDILITSVGTIGVSYLVDGHEFYFKDGNLTWIKSCSDKMLSLYLFQWLNSQGGKQQLLQSTIGTSQSALTIENLKKIKLIVPTKEIVEDYFNRTHAMMEQKRALQLNNQNLAAQRDMLLPRLMSGKLEV